MRRLGWKFWLVLMLIVGGMAFASLLSDDEEDLLLIREVIARVEAREITPVQRRAAIYGEVIDGDAMSHYAVATAAAKEAAAIWRGEAMSLLDMGSIPKAGMPTVPAVAPDAPAAAAPTPDPSEPTARAIEAMQLGAHSRSVACAKLIVRADEWSSVVRHACSDLLAAGKDVAAVEVWLDALVMCTDGEGTTDAVESFAKQWLDTELASLGPDARKRMLTGLVWLEGRLERSTDWERVLYPNARMAISGKLFNSKNWLQQLMAWDSGFSPQRKVINTMATCFRGLRLLVPNAPKWSERMQQFDAFESELKAVAGSVAGAHILRYREIWRRESLAHLRLLRAAVEIHDGGTVATIADPFTDGAITVLKRGDRIQLSAGGVVVRVSRTVKK